MAAMLFKKKPGRPTARAKWRLIGLAGKLFIDLLFLASRIEVRGLRAIEPLMASRRYIFAFWHSRILLLSYFYKGLNASIMVSNSADGEIIAQILTRQGHNTVRGSTRKGGLRALTSQIRDMRVNCRPGVVVPDGPQGPRHKAQLGVILLAQKTGCPIIPLTYSARHRRVFDSWDRFILPFPATSCLIVHGRPIAVPANADAARILACQTELEAEMNRITNQADACFGHSYEP